MPILDLQRRMVELGRIRTGVTVESKGKSRPSSLETFRLTSSSQAYIEAAAEALGGVAQPWGDGEWEVITSTDTLEILVPPGEPISQWYELWTAGGCQRRCNGEVMVLTDEPCLCPADPAERREQASAKVPTACKPTTRLNVMLAALPGLGVWRLESHGYYAATELAGAATILAYASSAGHPIPARLRLEPREKKVPGKPINRYTVPVIDIVDRRVVDLLPPPPSTAQLTAGGAVRRDLPETPLPDGASDFRAPLTDSPGDDGPAHAGAAPVPAASDGLPPVVADSGPGLTQEEFLERLRSANVSLEYALAAVKRIWPDRVQGAPPLTEPQRGELWRRIERDLAGESGL